LGCDACPWLVRDEGTHGCMRRWRGISVLTCGGVHSTPHASCGSASISVQVPLPCSGNVLGTGKECGGWLHLQPASLAAVGLSCCWECDVGHTCVSQAGVRSGVAPARRAGLGCGSAFLCFLYTAHILIHTYMSVRGVCVGLPAYLSQPRAPHAPAQRCFQSVGPPHLVGVAVGAAVGVGLCTGAM
jgi:hypothetical protein